MKNIIQRATRRREKKFPRMENYFQASLKPVQPRPDFVRDLKGRLMATPLPAPDKTRTLAYAALGVAGVISGAVLLVTGVRALVIVAGGLAILRQMRGAPPVKVIA